MLVIIGTIIVLGSMMGGFMLSGGHPVALWQPYEWLVIVGCAFGALVIANPMPVVMGVLKSAGRLFAGSKYTKAFYLELLACLYDLFSRIRRDGLISIEGDVDDPNSSPTFSKYPLILKDHHYIEFLTDYLRIMVIGDMTAFEVENLMDIEIETHGHHEAAPAHALAGMADGFPGFGIVAAVLGIVITMGSISAPPEVLGHHIAAALVGTLSGILFAYGLVGPSAAALNGKVAEELKMYESTKVALLATLNGMPPQVAVEFGRKVLPSDARPTFAELDQRVRSK